MKKLNLENESYIFDRSGYLFHGRVKAFANALRDQGVKF
ncbi:50S ribosomal protein L18 [Mesomycoplasma hyopneumoniae 168]|nr:50S ribosomal protein L18 [Mesomycoplasma hyopneumoniae 168]AGM21907.1 50S ribosomal protein L18 [Mesomycoplasma hyopneumoniae 168-L]